MLLYHFTAREYLPAIRKQGLLYGDVPTSPTGGFNAPWLTSSPEVGQQTVWSLGSAYNKTGVRLTVDVPHGDPKLHSWLAWAAANEVPNWWLKALDSSPHWYIYTGQIPANWIVDEVYL